MKLEHCRDASCEAPVIWTITEKNGKRMPVDADPVEVPKGFRLLTGPEYGDGTTPVSRYCGRPEPGERLYVSHWSTCPAAERFRK